MFLMSHTYKFSRNVNFTNFVSEGLFMKSSLPQYKFCIRENVITKIIEKNPCSTFLKILYVYMVAF